MLNNVIIDLEKFYNLSLRIKLFNVGKNLIIKLIGIYFFV